MRPGKFFKKWRNHPNTYATTDMYIGRGGKWRSDGMRIAFEKGREYEKKYGELRKEVEHLKYLLMKRSAQPSLYLGTHAD